MSNTNTAPLLRRATVADVKPIHAALLAASSQGLLLPRSLSHLYNHIREFFVLEDAAGQVVGCSALSIVWEDLAEVCSLFVDESLRGKGYGRVLVNACIEDAKMLKTHRVFTLTYQTEFFAKVGFSEVGKDILPQKIWADCIHCAKFPDCDEIAMLITIG